MPDRPAARPLSGSRCRSARPPRAAPSASTCVPGSGAAARGTEHHRRVDVPADARALAGVRLRRARRPVRRPEWRDVGPLDDAARSELADRRARWAAALAGKGWRPPRPMEPRGRRVRP